MNHLFDYQNQRTKAKQSSNMDTSIAICIIRKIVSLPFACPSLFVTSCNVLRVFLSYFKHYCQIVFTIKAWKKPKYYIKHTFLSSGYFLYCLHVLKYFHLFHCVYLCVYLCMCHKSLGNDSNTNSKRKLKYYSD